MVSSPVDSLRETERNGRSLPFTRAKCSFTACNDSASIQLLPTQQPGHTFKPAFPGSYHNRAALPQAAHPDLKSAA